jgi:putative ABC transport system permease protein
MKESFRDQLTLLNPQFPELFSLSMLQGTRDGLKDAQSIMLSKSIADALFEDNALGKIIKFDNRDLLTVTGVFEDFPKTSQFAEVKMLVPIEYHFQFE